MAVMAEGQQRNSALTTSPSLLVGPTDSSLWNITLGELLRQQAGAAPSNPCVVFLESNQRATYEQLYHRTLAVAKGLLSAGIRHGDRVGILAGNCPPYVELLFACSHVGAVLVVLNCAYAPSELKSALKHSGCKLLFTSVTIGKVSNEPALQMLRDQFQRSQLEELQEIILLKQDVSFAFRCYDELIMSGKNTKDYVLLERIRSADARDICNFQYTSGTTGSPKAAMLTSRNLVNNGRFVGDRMLLGPGDILCCPPPLFHCFGLVLGLLAALTHGSSIVFPSETFQPLAVLEAVAKERCTVLHGVPAMFSAELELIKSEMDLSSLRTGIAAGASVPRKMMADLRETFNMREVTNTYGMTETSPASFMTFTNDPLEKRLSTVGKILPHMKAKIVDKEGNVVPTGSRGELCVSGYALQKGYWQNPEKTAEIMRADDSGTIWIHTGDEAVFDDEGYCRIMGRIKDIIIRGGENIFPLEIEERLMQHPAIVQASVVGISDTKYGEAVGAFLQHRASHGRPSIQELSEFVRKKLAWHKAPAHVFWLEPDEEFPKTGSGKIKKHVLRSHGEESLKRQKRWAHL